MKSQIEGVDMVLLQSGEQLGGKMEAGGGSGRGYGPSRMRVDGLIPNPICGSVSVIGAGDVGRQRDLAAALRRV